MMTDQPTSQPALTPDLVSLAIEHGMLDSALPALADVIRSRQEVLDNQKRYSLTRGDRFIIKNCSPKKWNGQQVTFVENDGMWLVCRSHTGSTIRLRTTHVGTILKG